MQCWLNIELKELKMKRSEMIQIILKEFPKWNNVIKLDNYDAEALLNIVEEAGMLPPEKVCECCCKLIPIPDIRDIIDNQILDYLEENKIKDQYMDEIENIFETWWNAHSPRYYESTTTEVNVVDII